MGVDPAREQDWKQYTLAMLLFSLLVCVTLKPFGLDSATRFSMPVLSALLVCLIPTTIGGLLSAIGISGIDRLIRRNVMAASGRAVEAAGDVDVLLLDKTGTRGYCLPGLQGQAHTKLPHPLADIV
jgi:P-type E1-E2 ATPase